LREIETGEIDYNSLSADGDEYTQPVVRLVGALLMDAVKRGASDIHLNQNMHSYASVTELMAYCNKCVACTKAIGAAWWFVLRL